MVMSLGGCILGCIDANYESAEEQETDDGESDGGDAADELATQDMERQRYFEGREK